MDEGTYSNCKLLEAVFADGKFGPQWALTFDISGTKRTVYLGVSTETNSKGETWQAVTTKTLLALGWNQDMDDPKFAANVYDPGIDLYMKVGNTGKERWYVSSGDFKAKPAAADAKQNFKAAFRALAGAQPRPASAKPPSAPPARTPPKPQESSDMFDTSGVTDRDTAFQCGLKYHPPLSDDNWNACIIKVEKATKRKEANFTTDDWKKLAYELAALSIPF